VRGRQLLAEADVVLTDRLAPRSLLAELAPDVEVIDAAKVPYVTQMLKDAPGPFIAASDYMKVLPESLSQWVPGQLVSLGTDGFGRSENRVALRDFFEVDAKHIVLATLGALAREKKIEPAILKKAIRDLGINPEKMNPAIS